MKRQPPSAGRQSGVALILFLVALILAGSYAFYRSSNIGSGRIEQDAKLAATLARAKEALIARAVTDANRPGSLPCPDLVTNNVGLANVPGDGKADMFTMTQCPSNVGWLPWVTLDLPELTDDTGTRLWYVLTPELRDDDSAQPINSDRALTLRVDGTADNVAALVIAARAPLGSQARPSNNPVDYLDGENGNGDDGIYVSGPPSASFNDMVVAITRQELMAAVEKRVANEVKACLEEHAASALNTAHTYPWPAPLANTTFRGTAGSLFGQVAATQPGAGPENLLKQSSTALSDAKNALASASTAADQMAALVVVNKAATYALTLYDKLYGVAAALATVAATVATSFSTLDTHIDTAAALNGINLSELTALRNEAVTGKTSLASLQLALNDSGIDPFPGEIETQNLALQQRISAVTTTPTVATLTALQSQVATMKTLYLSSTTPNPDIAAALAAALGTANAAAAAVAGAVIAPADTALVNAALAAAQTLVSSSSSLRNTIAASRVNLHASEISVRAVTVDGMLTAYNGNPGTTTAAALVTAMGDLQATTTALNTASSPVVAARGTTLAALNDAISAASAGSDQALIAASAGDVITAANALAAAIAGNGDNVARESIAEAATRYLLAQGALADPFVTTRTRAGRVPYVRALQDPAEDIAYWAQITARIAIDISTQARKAPNASGDNTASAYYAADQLTSGIAGASGTQALLQDYIDAPGNAAKQSAATTALNATASQLDTLLASAGTLDAVLDSGSAEAFPTLWYGTTCAFLQPASGSSSWWTANNWTNTTFYQISDRVRAASGKLQVGGSGTYRVVAASAGRALGAQNRATRTTANFLEGSNADASRDGNAQTPVPGFANAPLSGTFNDRLGY